MRCTTSIDKEEFDAKNAGAWRTSKRVDEDYRTRYVKRD